MYFPNTIPAALVRCFLTLLTGALVAGAEPPVSPVSPVSPPPLAPSVKLPGLSIDVVKRQVDVDATICLTNGALELIACTKDSKEHESIIVVGARASHIHAALLLLGAKAGSPAMRRPLDGDNIRWLDIPPSGDLIDIFLVCPDAEGKMVERPLSDFVCRTDEDEDEEEPAAKAAAKKFPSSFLFAGSLMRKNAEGPAEYLAESSGNIISIATFGDELLCLPDIESQENGSLLWQIDTTHLPKLGTKVTLRLRPQKQPAKEPKK